MGGGGRAGLWVISMAMGVSLSASVPAPEYKSNRSGLYKLVVHRIDIAFRVDSLDCADPVIKLFNVAETKERSGEKYTVTVYKEAKGESVAVYRYSDKIIVRVNTHRLQRRQYVVDYINKFGFSVVRDYAELYARVDPRFEASLTNAVISYARANGLDHKVSFVYKEWNILTELARVDKHSIGQDLNGVLKLYRDKELREDPKLEIEFYRRGLLSGEDWRVAGEVVATLLKLTRAKQVFNEYDKLQEYYVVSSYNIALYRKVYATMKRVGLSIVLNKDYKDKRLLVAELADRGFRPCDIARLMGYSDRRIRQILAELIDMGILTRVGRGKYQLVSRATRPQVTHPLPLHVVVNMEYDRIRVIDIPFRAWNKLQLISRFTSEGWLLHPHVAKFNIDGIVVFYRPSGEYLLVRRKLG